MKKTTLLVALLLTITTLEAQETTISFESSEGYTLGEINGQNGWLVGAFNSLFKVSDEQSTDGAQSFKGLIDTNNNIPGNGTVVGVLGPVYNDLSTDSLRMSCDLFLTASPTSKEVDDFEIFVYGQQQGNQTLYTARVVFSQGQILVETTDPNNPNGLVYQLVGPFSYDSFFNFRMDFDFTNDVINYYIDDIQIFSGDVFSGTEFDRFGFYTNGVDQFYVDNINLENDPNLGVKKIAASNFTHFVDQNGFLQLSSPNSPLQHVELFNLLGQQVVNRKLSSTSESINLNGLDSGMYIVQVRVQGKTKSFKIVK